MRRIMVVVRVLLESGLVFASLLLSRRIYSYFLLRMDWCSLVTILVGVIDCCISVVDMFDLTKG